MSVKTERITSSSRFAEVSSALQISGFGTFFSLGKETKEVLRYSPEVRLRRCIERCKGGILAFGQMLQYRPDLIPTSFAKELTHLHIQQKPCPIQEIIDAIEKEYSRPLETFFHSINKDPIEKDLFTQTHEATLTNKKIVFVKIVRPDIKKLIEKDMSIVEFLASKLKLPADSNLNTEKIIHEFRAFIQRKTDLHIERKFMIELSIASSEKLVPEVFENLCTKNVLIYRFVKNKTRFNQKQAIVLSHLEKDISTIQGEFLLGMSGIITIIISTFTTSLSPFISRTLLFFGLGCIVLAIIIIVKSMTKKNIR